MENVDNPPTEKEMNALRERIQHKYRTYHLFDRDRFPLFEYNTNRANYEPLRESFEEEFYEMRGMDRAKSNIHIPSTNTLARLFSENTYVPSWKIRNTCWSYAEGSAKQADVDNPVIVEQPETIRVWRGRAIRLAGLVFVVAVSCLVAVNWLRSSSPASGLLITRPSHDRTVPRELLATGEVTNAETVWLVVHPIGSVKYWVQPPINVQEDNTWRGGIYIGSDDKGDIGVRSQIRAFVNPAKTLHEGDVLHAWPEAELSTGITEVIRGNKKE